MKNILVIGSLNMDVTVRMDRLPTVGETILGSEYWNNPGGKGANQACAASRVGGEVTMLGCVGQDKYGAHMLEQLAAAGVQVDHILADREHPTGTAFVLTDMAGRNSIVVVAGANGRCSEAYIAQHESLFADTDCVLLQLEIPMDTVCAAVRRAKALSKLVILNPAPARGDLPPDLFPLIDVLTPNETELAALTGGPVERLDEVAQSAQILLGRGVGHVVVTLGSRGALLVDEGGARLIPGHRVIPVDSTGAGDCFNGVLAAELSGGSPLHEAVSAANLAASISVTRAGALTAMPGRAELAAALASTHCCVEKG